MAGSSYDWLVCGKAFGCHGGGELYRLNLTNGEYKSLGSGWKVRCGAKEARIDLDALSTHSVDRMRL